MNSFLIAVGSVGAALIVYAVYMMSRPRHVRHEIARDVRINNEWQILTPDRFMRMNKKRQMIELSINGLKLDTESGEMILGNSDVIDPELRIRDLNGNWLDLGGGSAYVGNHDPATSTMDVSSAHFKAQFAPDSVFTAIKIRSDVPFTCVSINWTNYVPKK